MTSRPIPRQSWDGGDWLNHEEYADVKARERELESEILEENASEAKRLIITEFRDPKACRQDNKPYKDHIHLPVADCESSSRREGFNTSR